MKAIVTDITSHKTERYYDMEFVRVERHIYTGKTEDKILSAIYRDFPYSRVEIEFIYEE